MKEKTSASKFPRIAFTIIIAVAILGIITARWTQPAQKAPDITFTLITGDKLSLIKLRGGPVLVFFWATTCKICIAKTPEMNSLYQQLQPEGLEMIAVAMPYDPPTHVVAMAKILKMPYPVALDINAEVVRAFDNVRVTPTTILIAPNGNITWRKQGKFDTGRLKFRIRELIQNSTAI